MLFRLRVSIIGLLAGAALALSGCGGGGGGGGEQSATPPVGGVPRPMPMPGPAPAPMPDPQPMPPPPAPMPQPMPPDPTPDPMPGPAPMPMPMPPPDPTPVPVPQPPPPAPAKAKLDAANAETFTTHSVLAAALLASLEGVTTFSFQSTPPGTLTIFQRAGCNNGTAEFRFNTESDVPLSGRFVEYDNCLGLVVNGSVSVRGRFALSPTPARDFIGLNLSFSGLDIRSIADNRSFKLTGTLQISRVPAFFTDPPGFFGTLNGSLFDADGALVLSMQDFVVRADTIGGRNLRVTSQGRVTDPMLGFVDTVVPARIELKTGSTGAISGVALIDGADQQATVTFTETGSTAVLRPLPLLRALLDEDFGSGGKVLTDFDNGFDFFGSLALQTDGKVLAAGGGGTATSGSFGLGLVRYNTNGSLDSSFGTGGKLVRRSGVGFTARDLKLQPDAKILVAGTTSDGGGDLAVARFNSDGSADATFGTAGVSVILLNASIGALPRIALQPDGKIVAAGDLPGGTYFLVRYLPDGTLDSSFGAEGIVRTRISFDGASLVSLLVQPDGKLVAAGTANLPNFNATLMVLRYNADGSLDTGFASGGKLQVLPPVTSAFLSGVVLQTDGRLLGAGNISKDRITGNSVQFKLLSDGSFDAGFGSEGILTSDVIFGDGRIALQPDGKLVSVGTVSFGPFTRIRLSRVNVDGSLDTGFGNDGMLMTDFGNTDASAFALLVQPNGRIVACGSARGDASLVRFRVDP